MKCCFPESKMLGENTEAVILLTPSQNTHSTYCQNKHRMRD